MNERKKPGQSLPAMLFDLDGTLVDSVYQHVIAWSESFDHYGVHIPAWKIHRRTGMSGKLFAPMLLREIGHKADRTRIEELEKRELRNFERQLREVRILPGAVDLVRGLSRLGISWALATSGNRRQVEKLLKGLHVPPSVPVITGDDVKSAKPASVPGYRTAPRCFPQRLRGESLGSSRCTAHESTGSGFVMWRLR